MTIVIDPIWVVLACFIGYLVGGCFIVWSFLDKKLDNEVFAFPLAFWPVTLVVIAIIGIIKEFVYRYKVVHSPKKKCI